MDGLPVILGTHLDVVTFCGRSLLWSMTKVKSYLPRDPRLLLGSVKLKIVPPDGFASYQILPP